VFAVNSAGLSSPVISSPNRVFPIVNIPGKPFNLNVAPGQSGELKLSWLPPNIPWHQIPCFGTVLVPGSCPNEIGGGIPGSYGGSAISEYEVSYNEQEDFSGFDSGQWTTSQTSFILSGLTSQRRYFIRVLARNIAGAGPFSVVVSAVAA
jgi:hypothetical protein